MPSLADASAYRDENRLLVQHQAALTVLQGLVMKPGRDRVRWLDLSCGRGQIIATLNTNLSENARAKIAYYAYDVDQNYVRETERRATQLGFMSIETKVGDLSDFAVLIPENYSFEFITFTNTAHEVRPPILAALLVECFVRLADDGCLFIYDMDVIKPEELGAVPWTGGEFQAILKALFGACGLNHYQPEVGRWRHSSCEGWNAQIHRDHVAVTAGDLPHLKEVASAAVVTTMASLLENKLRLCSEGLETLTRFGTETAEEVEAKSRHLYNFWALSRALDRIKP
jgi:SAM-dependent methyltransferase